MSGPLFSPSSFHLTPFVSLFFSFLFFSFSSLVSLYHDDVAGKDIRTFLASKKDENALEASLEVLFANPSEIAEVRDHSISTKLTTRLIFFFFF